MSKPTLKSLDERLKRVEKREKSIWRHPLFIAIIAVLLGIFLPIGINYISSFKFKPNETRCAVIYLEDDSFSKRDAKIVRDVLAKVEQNEFKRYTVVERDSAWYSKHFHWQSSIPLNNSNIDIGYNAPVNAERADWVYFRLKEALFVKDSTGQGTRDSTLPFNIPGAEVFLADIQPEVLMDSFAKIRKYAVVVIVPPYEWYYE